METMTSEIIKLINQEDFDEAANLFIKVMETEPFTDTLAVLGATINQYYNDRQTTFEYIKNGLYYNSSNYELYVLLGNYYLSENVDLAYLCYENALYYCEKESNEDDLLLITDIISNLKKSYEISVSPCSIVIRSDSAAEINDCIKSIQISCKKECYEIIVYVNDDPKKLIKTDANIKFIDYTGESEAVYNYLIEQAVGQNDILILDTNTYMMPNSLFVMRMALYSDSNIGSVGAMSNCAGPDQIIQSNCRSIEEYQAFSKKINIPQKFAVEYKMWLESYAILIKRCAIDKVGMIDTKLVFNQYIENDLGLRLLTAGFKNVLCHNCVLFRHIERCITQLNNKKISDQIQRQNENYFKNKWSKHNNPLYYNSVRRELIQLIKEPSDTPIKVLEVGCGTGATLNNIKYAYPNATVKGIEIVDEIAKLGAINSDIINGDIENLELPYEFDFFDYIIFGDVLEHLKYPENVLIKVKPYIKKGGHIITSIPNIMNAYVIYNLLRGYFTYEDAGILDKTHLRFFTYSEIVKMFERTEYQIDQVVMNQNDAYGTEQFKEFFEQLLNISGVADKNQFDTFQYYVLATKK